MHHASRTRGGGWPQAAGCVRDGPAATLMVNGMSQIYELLSDTSLNTRNASLYASSNALTRVRSVTNASSSCSSSANRSGLYRDVTSRCCTASREKLTWRDRQHSHRKKRSPFLWGCSVDDQDTEQVPDTPTWPPSFNQLLLTSRCMIDLGTRSSMVRRTMPK